MLADTRLLFVAIVLLVGIQRLSEIWLSRRNERRLRARGGLEKTRRQLPWMISMHFLFPFAMVAEVYGLERPLFSPLALTMITVLVLCQALRYWTVSTLGDRWTVSIMVVPGEQIKRDGPYRFLKHPNYLAVGLEMAALPLVHTAWLSAVVFSLLNSLLLHWRIREENVALEEAFQVPENRRRSA